MPGRSAFVPIPLAALLVLLFSVPVSAQDERRAESAPDFAADAPADAPAAAPATGAPEAAQPPDSAAEGPAPAGDRDWGNRRLGLDFGLFTAWGSLTRRDIGWAVPNRDDSFAFSGPLRPDFSVWWQSAISRYYEMGVGTRVRFNRTLGTDDDESAAFMQTLGSSMGVFWIHEGSIPVAPGTSIQVGFRVGGDLIFTSGDLDDQISDIRQAGFDPWKGPRGGVFVDPRIGTRYVLPSAPMALRTDFGLGWERYWFWDRTDRLNTVPRDRVAYSNATTFRWSLGAEFLF